MFEDGHHSSFFIFVCLIGCLPSSSSSSSPTQIEILSCIVSNTYSKPLPVCIYPGYFFFVYYILQRIAKKPRLFSLFCFTSPNPTHTHTLSDSIFFIFCHHYCCYAIGRRRNLNKKYATKLNNTHKIKPKKKTYNYMLSFKK